MNLLFFNSFGEHLIVRNVGSDVFETYLDLNFKLICSLGRSAVQYRNFDAYVGRLVRERLLLKLLCY